MTHESHLKSFIEAECIQRLYRIYFTVFKVSGRTQCNVLSGSVLTHTFTGLAEYFC